MRKHPMLSVVMPVYDAEKYLDEAIKSILVQTFENFEFIIVNDGSKDQSLDIIKKYKNQDDRIVLVDRQNSGIVDALNEGISKANGKFIARMDADDIAFSNRFQKQVDILVADDSLDLIYTNTVLLDKNSSVICTSWRPNLEITLRNLEIHTYIPHPTVIFKKATFEKLGGYTKERMHAEDLSLWLKMVQNKCNFHYLDEALLYYRLNPQSVRLGMYDNYWYKVANRCIYSGSRLQVFKYFKYLNAKEKAILFVKMFFPKSFFHRNIR
ncbi:MAG: glycosyltransferase [Rhizobiales bacterium]|nr:glycosyltransferase [Hyphomicrobiales bacterium]NRB14946.1 glycosyltransferase [Hyphomicrobiales bacterium]